MPRIPQLLIGSCILLLPLSASYGESKRLNHYMGSGLQFTSLQTQGISPSSNMPFSVKTGTHLSTPLAAELIYTLPTSETKVSWNGTQVKQKINSIVTGRFRYGFVNYFGYEAYGTFGLSFVSLDYEDFSNGNAQASQNTLDMSYGAGIRTQFLPHYPVTGYVEYSNLFSSSNLEVNQFSIGLDYYY